MKTVLDLPSVSHFPDCVLADIVECDSESLETFAARLELSERLQTDWRDIAPFRPRTEVLGVTWHDVATVFDSYM